LALRYARRTLRLTATVGRLAIALAGRAGAAVLAGLGVPLSRSTLLRVLMALPIPPAPTPTVLSVDDVALRRGRRYATMLIDAVTHRRVDVMPDRKAATLAAWLREHPGAQVVCRDGSAAYAEAIRQGAPDAVQASDRPPSGGYAASGRARRRNPVERTGGSADLGWPAGRLVRVDKRIQAGEVGVPCAVSDLVGAGTADDSAAGGADGGAVSQGVGRGQRGESPGGVVLCHVGPPSRIAVTSQGLARVVGTGSGMIGFAPSAACVTAPLQVLDLPQRAGRGVA
jgi:hypothetical protein